MRVLVTGATGFVGSHLAEALVNQGHEIRALVRQSGDTSLLKKLGVEVAYGDITDAAAVEGAIRGCQYVYHLAAKTARSGVSKKEYYAVNVEGTENVARAAIKANVERLVYGSSAGVYGTTTRTPVDENTKPNPNSYYRESKLLGEKVMLAYQTWYMSRCA